MSRTTRVSRLEALAAERPADPVDWDAAGALGALTFHCLELFLTREDQLDAHGHQLMTVGSLALDCLTEKAVPTARIEATRRLMMDPAYRAYGWTKRKHPDALALYVLLLSDGKLGPADGGVCSGA